MNSILFFKSVKGSTTKGEGPTGNEHQLRKWSPGIFRYSFAGMSKTRAYCYWLFHFTGVFKSNDYCVAYVVDGGKIIHHTVVFPAFYRFPFMRREDLQIGYVWTAESHRGRGVAKDTIRTILAEWFADRTFWYLCEHDNIPSVRTAAALGFVEVGYGEKHSPYGLPVFDRYQIINHHGGTKHEQ